MALTSEFKGVLFDMDGVLVDARDWHFLALNEALEPFGFQISREDHLGRFDGLSTRSKLKILSEEFGFPSSLHSLVDAIKQDRTLRIASQFCYPNVQHQILLSRIYQKKIPIGVVTNSIKKSAHTLLGYAQLVEFLEVIVTNQDVKKQKPDPECYLLACEKLRILPSEALVVEDGDYGVSAAEAAGCHVVRVNSPSDVSLELLAKYIPELVFDAP
jgi:beta-phosphoglucomutase-like phosphatase (HAD superfamily)